MRRNRFTLIRANARKSETIAVVLTIWFSLLAWEVRRRVGDFDLGDIQTINSNIANLTYVTLHSVLLSCPLIQFAIAHIIVHIAFFTSSHCSQSSSRIQIRLIAF